jgi:hypothetical protein
LASISSLDTVLASVDNFNKVVGKRCQVGMLHWQALQKKKVGREKSQALASVSICGYCFGKHSMTKKLKYFFFSVCKHEDQISHFWQAFLQKPLKNLNFLNLILYK